MGLQQKLLQKAGYKILSGDTTKQKIIEDLIDAQDQHQISDTKLFLHSSATYITDELHALLQTGGDMNIFLVEMWGADESYIYRTKNAGVFEVTNPYFNLIGAMVPEMFASTLANDLSSTGLLARCIIVFKRDKRAPWPDPYIDEEQEKALKRCFDRILKIKRLYGPMKESPEAKKFYSDWYISQKISQGEDYRMAGYLERRNKVHVIKVAALMCIGDGRDEITVLDYERAINLFTLTDKDMRIAYQLTGSNKLAPYMQRMISLLDNNKGKILLIDAARIFTPDLAYYDFKNLINALIYNDEIEVKKTEETGQIFIYRSSYGKKD